MPKRWNADKLNDTIDGRFTAGQLEYMKETGISPEQFRRVAELGRSWLAARGVNVARTVARQTDNR